MRAGGQTTLRKSTALIGTGVHSNFPLTVTLHPAAADTGIVFVRNEPGSREREIRAQPCAVVATEFATVLGDNDGPAVSTIEHVLAALHGLGIDNAAIELDGPEVPIMDGSAAPFVDAIDAAGIVRLPQPRRYLRVLKPVGVVAGDSYGELRPYSRGFRLEVEIDFSHPTIGRQSLALDLDPTVFRRQLARARTFGFVRDVERLWGAGYALGASLENTLVLSDDGVVNPEGLRFDDEFVRHKALDAVGDLALAGLPILGAYRSIRGGHRLNYAVLSALLADSAAWTVVEPTVAKVEVREVARRVRGYGQLAALPQPAMAPDLS
ncbi:MAG TPA: UDP-3-O-acyl-N-acetylglucosamine deacetylase [Xanthobacteraceae bacterium]|nr:UDP-3-O-acyl-N-acetylglucosamine deacetylase [Xanthobacteraceae bacterium]